MVREIVEIDEEKCTGCGLCAEACHEGAIGMVGGKAKLLRDDYCDGMGDCLPECPAGAVRITRRESAAYDEKAVKEHREEERKKQAFIKAVSLTPPVTGNSGIPGGCPGSRVQLFDRGEETETAGSRSMKPGSQLRQWPVQIRLVSPSASFFQEAKLLVAADCTAYAYAGFHQDFMRGRVTLIGCPKLDDTDYSEKLTEIIRDNNIREVTVVRMQVPCCGGLQRAVETSLRNSGKSIPWRVITISETGEILN
jgi:Fe-S-cluster-containing hydrogenase component 2